MSFLPWLYVPTVGNKNFIHGITITFLTFFNSNTWEKLYFLGELVPKYKDSLIYNDIVKFLGKTLQKKAQILFSLQPIKRWKLPNRFWFHSLLFCVGFLFQQLGCLSKGQVLLVSYFSQWDEIFCPAHKKWHQYMYWCHYLWAGQNISSLDKFFSWILFEKSLVKDTYSNIFHLKHKKVSFFNHF